MLKNLSKEARSKEFRRQEEELRPNTLVAETSTHYINHLEGVKEGQNKSVPYIDGYLQCEI